MTASIVRSRIAVIGATGRFAYESVPDGAVLHEDGVIQEVAPFETLRARFPDTPVLGSGREVLLPGFVNAHHHVGLTPLQLGSPDMPLELWWITRMVCRGVDPYLDTLYGAIDMIGSGITTVQHIHGWVPGGPDEVIAASRAVLRAYDDVGMRASYCYAVREQNRLVYAADDEFVASLPPELRGPMRAWFDRFRTGLPDMMTLFETLHAEHAGRRLSRIQLAPANLHWCSDHALEVLAEAGRRNGVKLHIHLLETAYQREYARRRTGGGTAVAHLERLGLLGPDLTIGHGTWLDEAEIERLAATGTCVCHNCSSNMRLRSGTAPLNRLEAGGVPTAIGLDEAGLNDDRDMLQEMRLVLRAHRVPGMEEADVPGVAQVFRMATAGGARTTGFEGLIGEIRPGMAADLVLLDWDALAHPYLDPRTGVLEAVVQRARRGAVRSVVCDGRVILHEGRIATLDADAAMRTLHGQMLSALSDDEVRRRDLSHRLLPHVRAFYRDYVDPARHEPSRRPAAPRPDHPVRTPSPG